jgi:hypothetical protein
MVNTKQFKERVLLAVLLVIAVSVWHFYFGRNQTATGALAASASYTPINAEDYGVVFERLKNAQETEYKPSGRNIFIAAPPPAPKTEAVAPVEEPHLAVGPQLPPPPPAPTLSMKFFGYGTTQSNGPRRAFLLDGDEVHIVQEGDTILNHIRITHIGNDRIEYEDINTGMKNSSTLEMPPAV